MMPGTIQISVLEFKGLPAESPPALLKVSLGKREYQTSDMIDFSFPLTTLRDNLVVALQDAEGNELAHLGIRTMSIVEKVSWDNIFPLDGGGYLHLKLKFMLSQQEQTRIRAMREAAMKEKQGAINARDPGTTISVSATGPSSSQAEQTVSDLQTISGLQVESLDVSVQAGSLSKPSTLLDIPQPDYVKEERSKPSKEFPKDIDNKEGEGSDPSVQGAESHTAKKIDSQSSLHCPPIKSVSSQEVSSKQGLPVSIVASTSVSLNSREDQVEMSEQLGPRGKKFSKVKKIASAFESGLPQDVKYTLNPSAVKSGTKKVRKGGHPMEYGPTDASEEIGPNSGLVAEGSEADSERANNKFSAESYVGDVESQATSTSKQSKSLATDPRIDDTGTEEKGGNSDTSSTRETASTPGTEQSTSVVTVPKMDNTGTVEKGKSSGNSVTSSTSETANTPGTEQSTSVVTDPKIDDTGTEEKGKSSGNSDTSSTSDTATTPGPEQSTSAVSDPRMDVIGTEETGMSTGNSDRSSISETATTPGRKLDYHSENVHLFDLSVKKQYSGGSSNSEGKRRKDSHPTKFNPSNDKSISLEYREEDLFLMGKSEAKSYQDKKNVNILGDPMEHETDEEKEKDSQTSEDTRKSRPESPSNDASSGLVAQVVKVAVIVGFGVLVLLTRQRQPRKTTSTNLEDLDLFKSSEYRKGQVLGEAEMD